MPLGIQETSIGRFRQPELFLANLDADTTGTLVAAAADLVLIVDDKGIIRDVAVGNSELQSRDYVDWVGKPWSQTVTIESRPKVEDMLREAGHGGPAKWRHVNHPSTDGADLPLSYSVVPVRSTREAGKSGARHSVVFGRDMERDYWRLRHVETRYRLLFQVAAEGVLILDASTEKLEDANPAAYKLLGESARRTGWTLADSLDTLAVAEVEKLFFGLRTHGKSEPVVIRFIGNAESFMLSGSLFRQESASHFLLRFIPSQQVKPDTQKSGRQLLLHAVESAPDAFVVTDLDGRVLVVNQAFLELAQLANEELARGESLEKWLGRTGVDLSVLISNLRQRGAVRLFATRMRGEFGSISEVEISAVAVTTGEQPCLGFTIRDVGRRLTNDTRVSRELPRSAGQMTELVGRVPLRDIVRETTDLIEQLCIEAALELTGDNRASAAEMLGLSRQSLYVKLRRFGVGDTLAES